MRPDDTAASLHERIKDGGAAGCTRPPTGRRRWPPLGRLRRRSGATRPGPTRGARREGAALGLRQDGPGRPGRRACATSAGSWWPAATRRPPWPRPASPTPRWPRSPGRPRCSAAGSRPCTRPSTAASWPTGPSPAPGRPRGPGHRADRPGGLQPLPVHARTPRIELIDVGGPTMVRAAAKNYAHVGVVSRPGRLPAGPRRAAPDGVAVRRHPAPAGPGRLRPHRGLRRGHRGLARPGGPGRRRRAAARPCTSPSSGPRRCATARTPTSAVPATGPGRRADAGGTGSSSTGAGALLPQPLRRRRRLAAGPRAGHRRRRAGGGHHQARQPLRGGGGRRPDRRPTAGPSSATRCRPSGASWPSAARARRRWPRPIAEGPQADVIIAPAYEPEALAHLSARRKATRLLSAPGPSRSPASSAAWAAASWSRTPTASSASRSNWQVVTKAVPTAEQWRDLELAWRVCARTTSNAIAIVTDGQAVGIGAGQQSRVVAAEIAVRQGRGPGQGRGRGASDAFFPFPDGLEVLARAGVTAVVQPGGSVRDARGHRRGRRGRAWPWSSPASGTSGTDARADGRGDGAAPRRRAPGGPHPGRGGRPGGPAGRRGGGPVGLGTVLVGDDGPSARYVAMKHADCAEVGIVSVHEHLPADATQAELEAVVARLQRRPGGPRLPGPAPPARRARRGAGPAGRGPGQGRRRPAPGEPGPPGHGAPRSPARAPRPASSSCWRPTTSRSRVATWSSSAGASPSAGPWPCSWP